MRAYEYACFEGSLSGLNRMVTCLFFVSPPMGTGLVFPYGHAIGDTTALFKFLIVLAKRFLPFIAIRRHPYSNGTELQSSKSICNLLAQ